jgi:hypothetical protein
MLVVMAKQYAKKHKHEHVGATKLETGLQKSRKIRRSSPTLRPFRRKYHSVRRHISDATTLHTYSYEILQSNKRRLFLAKNFLFFKLLTVTKMYKCLECDQRLVR